MSIHLIRKIVLTAALFTQEPTTYPASVPAAPAAATKYDFRWEAYTVNVASAGRAFYIFQESQPVGIASLDWRGRPEIFPIISGIAAEELKASFARYKKANGVGAIPLSDVVPGALSSRATIRALQKAPAVAFTTLGIHVSLVDGTDVYFTTSGIEVSMPNVITALPPNVVTFTWPIRPQTTRNRCSGETITINGRAFRLAMNGSVREGLIALVLKPALGKAEQAAQFARASTSYSSLNDVAFVGDIEKCLGN